MLIIKKLTKKYENKTICNKISLTFPNQGLYSIIGESGCGKSTLLNLIGCLDEEYEGEMFFDGHNYRIEANNIRKKIGIIYQSYNLLEDLSVKDNITISLKIKGLVDDKIIEKTCEKLNLSTDLLNKKAKVLSGGEKQRVALARILVTKPKIILADEPTGSLDSSNGNKVLEYLKEVSKDTLVILVTHNKDLAYKYSDDVILFESLNGYDKRDKKRKYDYKENKDNSNFLILKSHFKSNAFRHILSCIALVVSFVFSSFSLSFFLNATPLLENVSSNYVDKDVFSISKTFSHKIDNSFFSLTTVERPTFDELKSLSKILPPIDFYYSLNPFVPEIIDINDYTILNVSFVPCFVPMESNEVIINSLLFKEMKEEKIFFDIEKSYFIEDQGYSFSHRFSYEIKSVVEEVGLLNTKKIYYNYFNMYNLLDSYITRDKSPIELIKEAKSDEELSSYKMLMHLKSKQNVSLLYEIINRGITNYEITSNAYSIDSTLYQIADALKLVLTMFEIIIAISCFAIVFFLVVSLLNDYTKEKAILLSLGKNRKSFFTLYLQEILIVLLFSFVIGVITLIFLKQLIQKFIITYNFGISFNVLPATLIVMITYIVIMTLILLITNKKFERKNLINYLRNE
ncbi:MAG: ATP-binding cassette domain-containing protein [Erysipelotrichaceae bacterium]|nr:ATP-binding cassette domain-containing protein [Erysipelotrichaceae bacterium]